MTVTPIQTDDLYHYTSTEIGLDSVMTQMQLRLGLVESTNDPRESRPRYPGLQLAEGVPHEGTEDIWHEADRLVRRAAKVACFTLDYELPDSVLDSGALRGYACPALWAHYGARHTGVCLRFSRRALGERIHEALASKGQLFDGEVDYTLDPYGDREVRPFDVEQLDEFGIDAVVFRYIEQHHRALFFRKHVDWASEREFRWIFVNPGPLPAYIDIAGCLTGIVLGDNFPQSRLGAVHHLVAGCDGLELSQVKFHNGWQHRLPVPPPASRSSRAHRRTGSRDERVRALVEAEAVAEDARALGEQVAAPSLARISTAIEQIAARARALSAVEVDVYVRINAVPARERRRAAGVPTNSVDYEGGVMCVVEGLPRQSLTFVASAAVQVLKGGRLKLHAAFDLERWQSSGNEHWALWRVSLPLEPGAADAERRIEELMNQMLDGLGAALATFDERRDERAPST